MIELKIPIITATGEPVADMRSAADWKRQKLPGHEIQGIDPGAHLREEHHRAYGRPWLLGRYYFEALLAFGVRPEQTVVDLGCGAGRMGVFLIPYLNVGRYCGVEHHLASLVAFSAYEAVLHDLAAKAPRLMLDGDFAVEGFGEKFDLVLDLFTTAHLPADRAEAALARVAGACRSGALMLRPHGPTLPAERIEAAGWDLEETRETPYPLLKASDLWHLYRLR